MIAQQITHKMLIYKDNQPVMDLLLIMKQMAESLEVANVKANAALVKVSEHYTPDARGK